MPDTSPTILWLRRDLRLSDHPALRAACDAGGPVIPVFIHDEQVAALGAAPKWRLGLALEYLAGSLADKGSRLVLRRGDALTVLRGLIEETGARFVCWTRAYDPDAIARDSAVKAALKEDGIEARSFGGHLLFEPWTVETKQGGVYKVYTPFWNAVKGRDVAAPLATPGTIPAPDRWPASDVLGDWRLGAAMNRGADVVRPHVQLGEGGAQSRLGVFMAHKVADYDKLRDIMAEDGTSALSENLAQGEISPHQCWHAGLRAREEGKKGAETFLKELAWREFAYHLTYHTPRILSGNWREEWDAFPWNQDETVAVTRWKQGRTGVEMIDAAMREMYVTGRMHNRGRMIVASFLTKHLLTHWRVGQKWFEDCLIDWDPASNAMGWQWAAGSGPDASPYFRVFNPATQLDKFDPDRRYVRRWIAEGQGTPPATATSYFAAVPRRWGLSPDQPYPAPVVALDEGRKKALAAYENRSF
ncbi:DNA photolyase family protein [Lutimaribacter sp. EGI FJ00015]|uniref:DNA photolyase family protein n=1 Tax=Lutimaribacter degradans TaxID=2945989 RepID=A0ACC5ZWR5_9RHOB|nr:deoxyribodipyrimidine photo-lyase [Lutimaribacter sp. EGI FJ00013]MCM2562486.1 DNA photolyase family protein [Lutimaribacter sp. EGI FJ00013]MCO0613643.1 DNA photolyase family protein [Lutimaribacter sp. EGI FJ00015]MCO0636615.1 DNA photolyase family protein [Lutimaribacter sp. EGI FJ00014]